MLFLPTVQFRLPRSARLRRCRFHFRLQFGNNFRKFLKHPLHIAHNRYVWHAILSDFRGIDIHVNNLRVRSMKLTTRDIRTIDKIGVTAYAKRYGVKLG